MSEDAANSTARKSLTYSPAVRTGDYIFVSGLTATNEEGKLVHPGDIVGQTRAIYRKIEGILQSFDAKLSDIVDTLEFFIPDPRYKETADVRREIFGDGRYPASTGIPVQSLIRKGALIEIKVTAYAPKGLSDPT
jgi:aminoacrylate peracid reductase